MSSTFSRVFMQTPKWSEMPQLTSQRHKLGTGELLTEGFISFGLLPSNNTHIVILPNSRQERDTLSTHPHSTHNRLCHPLKWRSVTCSTILTATRITITHEKKHQLNTRQECCNMNRSVVDCVVRSKLNH